MIGCGTGGTSLFKNSEKNHTSVPVGRREVFILRTPKSSDLFLSLIRSMVDTVCRIWVLLVVRAYPLDDNKKRKEGKDKGQEK